MEELWDLYYKDRRPCGVTVPRKDKNGNSPNIPEGCYHIVVECMVIDMSARKLLVTQRSSDKHHGSYWECTAGSIIAGETSLDGVIREIKEETGLTVKKEQLTLLATHYRDVVIRDTYVCLIPKFNPKADRDAVNRKIETAVEGTDVRVVDILAESDTLRWHQTIATDPAAWQHYWAPGGPLEQGIQLLGLSSMPWYAVTDTTGLVTYNGPDLTQALRAAHAPE